ncbi:TetR/AcrR family transcriptional regulator [Streptomyces sp. NPDC004609]|uniref:TetR/AcrR family transcriptional regulator n=1 Tax=Streptomyces sp. NPDC004609 TaxID=3364704 RepID=UPI0036CFBF00
MAGRRAAARKRNEEALIKAAEQLFVEHGYHAVGIEAIARKADLTTGAIYSIFGSKQGLLYAVIDSQLGGIKAATAFLGDAPELSLERAVEAYTRAYFESVDGVDGWRALRIESEALGLALQGDGSSGTSFHDSVDEPQQRLVRLLAGRATPSGPLPPDDAARLAATLSALLRGLSQQHVLGLPPTDSATWVRAALGVTSALCP